MRAARWWSVDLSNTFYHERGRVSMTNEELAKEIQSGDKDKLLELWAQVKRFAHNWAYKWTVALNGRGGLSVDDFEQVAFLALLEALEGWEDRGGSFLTWYGLKLRGAFSEASGQRTKRDQLDPIQSAVSLETPLADREGDLLYLEDVIPDPRAEEALESIGEWEALHRAVDGLPEHQRTVIRRRYWLEQKVDHKIHAAALRALRHPRVSRDLRAYLT